MSLTDGPNLRGKREIAGRSVVREVEPIFLISGRYALPAKEHLSRNSPFFACQQPKRRKLLKEV